MRILLVKLVALALVVAITWTLTGCAALDRPQAAVGADAASTAAALSKGALEANPMGWASVPFRLAANEYAKTQPDQDRIPLQHAIEAGGWGAAANNLLVIGGLGPGALVVGALVGLFLWQDGAEEREFWQICALHRRDNPSLTCTYQPT